MKGSIPPRGGLSEFIVQIRTSRASSVEKTESASCSADEEMFRNGVSLCADICNTADTFCIKKESRIRYINLIEVFGIDPSKAEKRMSEAASVAEAAAWMGLPHFIVPHSVYSVSLPLFRLLKSSTGANRVTSIHFMETAAETEFVSSHSGLMAESYRRTGLMPEKPEIANDHTDAILSEVTSSGNLILVHNTFINKEVITDLKKRKNLYFCLCPNSNSYIENKLPPVDLLIREECEMVTGTDSLASNTKLGILDELITLQRNFPDINIEELIRWGTLNGARALGEEKNFGSLEPGKKPGLLLLQNVDLENMKLLEDSYVTRLV
jgi:cytosine/adenosine deaminase-related metal-dependent hydrolase